MPPGPPAPTTTGRLLPRLGLWEGEAAARLVRVLGDSEPAATNAPAWPFEGRPPAAANDFVISQSKRSPAGSFGSLLPFCARQRTLLSFFAPMTPAFLPPSASGLVAAAARQSQLTKPVGSLGALEHLVLDLARIQNAERPLARPAAAVIFAADHPVVQHSAAAYPSSATAGMVVNLSRGGSAAAVAADWVLGICLQVHDVGVDMPYDIPLNGSSAEVIKHRFSGLAAGDIRVQDAMSPELFEASVAAGRSAVLGLEPRPKVLMVGEVGFGNVTPATAVTAALLNRPVAELVGSTAGPTAGPTDGVDEADRSRTLEVVSDALSRLDSTDQSLEVLRRLGGRELASIVGAVQAAKEIGAAVLVDGFVVTAAIYAAVLDDPSLRENLIFGHRSGEPGHSMLLDAMRAKPLLDLGFRLGEASGALAAFGLVEYAARLHSDMATFADAELDKPIRADVASELLGGR